MRLSLPVVAGLALAIRPSFADPTDSVAAAEQVFEQARALFDQGNFAEACPRFAASYKLDPALGTLLNMATCYEMLGHIASAWGHYREVIALATKVGDTARIDIARKRIAALEPRLPKLTIKGPKTPIPGLFVTRDDAPLDLAVLGAEIFVDPGDHVIGATAVGYKPFTATISIREAEARTVELVLEPAPEAAHPQSPTVTTIVREDLDPGRSRRVFALTLGGAGVAALVTGIGFGFAARDSWNSAFDDGECNRMTLECTRDGQDMTRTAHTRALIANVVGGVGVAMIATGAVLYFTAPKRADVAVTPTQGGAAVWLGGQF